MGACRAPQSCGARETFANLDCLASTLVTLPELLGPTMGAVGELSINFLLIFLS